eukprot:601773-Rhodomonas_salina.1
MGDKGWKRQRQSQSQRDRARETEPETETEEEREREREPATEPQRQTQSEREERRRETWAGIGGKGFWMPSRGSSEEKYTSTRNAFTGAFNARDAST